MVPAAAAKAAPTYSQGPPSSQCFFSLCPLRQKSIMNLTARPISGSRGRPLGSASAQAFACKWRKLLAGAATHRSENQRSVKCSWEAPDSADLHFTREFVAFFFPSLLPYFPLHSATECIKHEVRQKSSEQ